MAYPSTQHDAMQETYPDPSHISVCPYLDSVFTQCSESVWLRETGFSYLGRGFKSLLITYSELVSE